MPPASRSVFYGFGSWVGSQVGLTTCSWWPNDPADPSINWDTNLLISTDLSKNPQAYRTGSIALSAIKCDDKPSNGGDTKIGPTWPTGSTINGCWINKTVWDALAPGVQPARVPPYMECRDYELTNVVYWTGPLANRRFNGYYAQITSEQGQSALLSIWSGGRSLVHGEPPATSAWIDLSTDAMAIETGFTVIGCGLGNPKQGAVFLDSTTAANLGVLRPKLPPAQGL